MLTPLRRSLIWVPAIVIITGLISCMPMGNSSSYPGGYSSGYGYPYGGYPRPTYEDYERRRDRERHHEWENEQREWERHRDEQYRERHPGGVDPGTNRPSQVATPPPSPPKVENHCPPGFVEGHHRCTDSERRRGCKDIGGPNGFGCNNRGWAR